MSSTADIEGSVRSSAAGFVSALRPAHWLKNMLLAAPLVFGHAEITTALAAQFALAFASMCLAASAGYLINDIVDRDADRLHAVKSRRPVASGRIAVGGATIVAAIFAAAAIGLALVVGTTVAFCVAAYLIGTLSYTLLFKKLPVVDIVVLSSLYVWRMVVGGELAGLPLSWWLVVFAYSLFMALALAKRVDELVSGDADQNMSGRPYRPEHLARLRAGCIVLTVASIAAVMGYVGFSTAARTFYEAPFWLWASASGVAFWLIRIVVLAMRGKLAGDPVLFSASDPKSLLIAAFVVTALIAAM